MHAASGHRLHLRLALLTILASIFFQATAAAARTISDDDPSSTLISGPSIENVTTLAATAAVSPPLFVVRAKRGGPAVRTSPSDSAPSLSELYYDTYLPVYSQSTDASGAQWYAVRLWGALYGWIRADQTETGDSPLPTPVSASSSSDSSPSSQPSLASASVPLAANGILRDNYTLRDTADIAGQALGVVQPGEDVMVTAWRSDSSGSLWYHVRASEGTGWVWAGGVDLATSGQFPRDASGSHVSFIRGKGMWLPIPLLEMASPDAIVAAAQQLGLTHIYLEAGDSGRGFYGQDQANRLLPVAHRAGIHVVAWLLTSLNDVASDLSLCQSVAAYRAATGDAFDGIAPDIEDNMDSDDVRAFSEILRADVGSQALLVGVIYPVGTIIGQNHPIDGILSRSMDALAPMAYWHDEKRSFSTGEIADFIAGTVSDVHDAVGDARYPVEIIGQSYDAFSRNGAGQFSPTGAEVNAALTSARDVGAYSVSLFQWGTTTPPEWDALRSLGWSSTS